MKLKRVAQDGMKVRASAGAASFRRRQSLDRCRKEAEEQVRKLRREIAEDPSASSKRVTAAKERAARARLDAVEAALAELPEIEELRAERNAAKPSDAKRRGEIRVSTTDAECRVMKMADGGYRPAYNVQLATDSSGFIVGAEVTNRGVDQPHVVPMLDEIKRRTRKTPREYLVDGGFVSLENIQVVSDRGATPYAPVPLPRKAGIDPHVPKEDDTPELAAWRRRMGTKEAKRIYVQRGVLAERTNADLRVHRGLDRLNIRGLVKVKTVVLLAALSFQPSETGDRTAVAETGPARLRRHETSDQAGAARGTGASTGCEKTESHRTRLVGSPKAIPSRSLSRRLTAPARSPPSASRAPADRTPRTPRARTPAAGPS